MIHELCYMIHELCYQAREICLPTDRNQSASSANQRFPTPEARRHLLRQRESELVREHAHLPAMMGFVGKHVGQHCDTDRPGWSPSVSSEVNGGQTFVFRSTVNYLNDSGLSRPDFNAHMA